MSWGKSNEALGGYLKHLTDKSDVNKKAREMMNTRIKKVIGVDVTIMSGIFAHSMFYRFCYHHKELKQQILVLLMIMRMYKVFFKTDLLQWGITGNITGALKLTNLAMSEGYITREWLPPRKGVFFITIKGWELLKAYDEYYEKRMKFILKDNESGNLESKYRHMRKKFRKPQKCSFKSA